MSIKPFVKQSRVVAKNYTATKKQIEKEAEEGQLFLFDDKSVYSDHDEQEYISNLKTLSTSFRLSYPYLLDIISYGLTHDDGSIVRAGDYLQITYTIDAFKKRAFKEKMNYYQWDNLQAELIKFIKTPQYKNIRLESKKITSLVQPIILRIDKKDGTNINFHNDNYKEWHTISISFLSDIFENAYNKKFSFFFVPTAYTAFSKTVLNKILNLSKLGILKLDELRKSYTLEKHLKIFNYLLCIKGNRGNIINVDYESIAINSIPNYMTTSKGKAYTRNADIENDMSFFLIVNAFVNILSEPDKERIKPALMLNDSYEIIQTQDKNTGKMKNVIKLSKVTSNNIYTLVNKYTYELLSNNLWLDTLSEKNRAKMHKILDEINIETDNDSHLKCLSPYTKDVLGLAFSLWHA